jgi:hypothetical protein
MRVDSCFRLIPVGTLHWTTDVFLAHWVAPVLHQKLNVGCERTISVFPEFFLRIWGVQQIGVMLKDEISRKCGTFSVFT